MLLLLLCCCSAAALLLLLSLPFSSSSLVPHPPSVNLAPTKEDVRKRNVSFFPLEKLELKKKKWEKKSHFVCECVQTSGHLEKKPVFLLKGTQLIFGGGKKDFLLEFIFSNEFVALLRKITFFILGSHIFFLKEFTFV